MTVACAGAEAALIALLKGTAGPRLMAAVAHRDQGSGPTAGWIPYRPDTVLVESSIQAYR